MTYGALIKQARENHRLTQEQLAEELDISRQAVSKWEADLSKPTREKLDRLSEILEIPQEKWAEIDAEIEAAKRPPDNSKPWKIAAGVLGMVCLALSITLIAVLWPEPKAMDVDAGNAPGLAVAPVDMDMSYENGPIPDPESAPVLPETIPLKVDHDYIFGDWPMSEYDPAEIPFLDDAEQVMEHELWTGWFPDGTRLGLVKFGSYWNEEQEYSNMYVIWAPPVETTAGKLECHILYHIGEAYTKEDSGAPVVVPFENVQGFDGFKITISAAEGLYRASHYIAQRDDGSVCVITTTENEAKEADVDEDGVLEIVYHGGYWTVIDVKDGEEGAFRYVLDDEDWLSVGPYLSGFDDKRMAFVTLDASNTVLARYVLRDGKLVKTPDTDFSVADYPDAAGTQITFITDEEVLSDGFGPDVILPYNPDIRITHRQQAYIALQELYELTGLKVDACYCAAGEFGLVFSLLEDGFNHRSFYSFWLNADLGGYSYSLIPSFDIAWQELENDWSPLAFADAVKPEGANVAEKMRWYYDRLSALHTGETAESSFPEPIDWEGIHTGELWLENGDLFNMFYQFLDGEPVLCDLYGPYPDGVVNH